MARQTINTGTTANDGTGDSLRNAGNKINKTFKRYMAFLVKAIKYLRISS